MYLHCTKNLLDNIAPYHAITSLEDYNEEESLYSWHANLITVNRHKLILFVNDLTRYSLVLYKPKTKDYQRIDKLFKEALQIAFEEEGYTNDCIETYLQHCQEVVFTKTTGRKMLNRLNATWSSVSYFLSYLEEDSLLQRRLSYFATSDYLSYGNDHYQQPKIMMLKALCKMMNHPEEDYSNFYNIEAYQLKIQLNVHHQTIDRTIMIPSHATFNQLHTTIMYVFDWFDSHIHEFSILEEDASYSNVDYVPTNKKKLLIIDDALRNSEFYYDIDATKCCLECTTRLKEVFPYYKQCLYIYDFGDYWKHRITLEKVIHDNKVDRPILLERNGKRPPEDVGGANGYQEYLQVISNPNHKDYKSMITWARALLEQKQTIEEINKQLRGV